MTRNRVARFAFLAVAATPMIFAAPAGLQGQPRNRQNPKLEVVAETKLIMEGLLQANLRGLERHLRGVPNDQETWTFIRGQALLIAESGNLLLMRPPKNAGQDAWMDFAIELRSRAANLGRLAATRNVDGCRKAVMEIAWTCNRCHQTFQVKAQISPFQEKQP